MKTKLPSPFCTLHSALFILLSAFPLLAAPPASAQELPPLAQIVSNVVHFTQPTEAWTVTVTQTTTPPGTNAMPVGSGPGAPAIKSSVTQTPTVQTFDSTFEPRKRKWVAQPPRPQTVKASGASQGGTNQPPDQPAVQITIEMEPFLESLLSTNQALVTQEALDGRSCYKLDARSGADRLATLWVDNQRWHVSKAIVYVMNQKFAEVACEYREVNGRWLFSKVAVNHALDGSRADLEFGEYRQGGLK